jgi:hypothetical protein
MHCVYTALLCCAVVDCLCDVYMKSCEGCELLQYRVGSYRKNVWWCLIVLTLYSVSGDTTWNSELMLSRI